MVRRELEIKNRLGLHARAAAKFVRCSGQFSCQVTIRRGDTCVDGKSIMGVLMLAAEMGSHLKISAHGDDAAEAVAALSDLVGRGFGDLEA